MPKFRVCLQQYVEQITEIEIEAENERDAISLARTEASEATWAPGDDAYSVEAYAVKDADGELVWER